MTFATRYMLNGCLQLDKEGKTRTGYPTGIKHGCSELKKTPTAHTLAEKTKESQETQRGMWVRKIF